MIASHGMATALSSPSARLTALDVERIALDLKLDEPRDVSNAKRTRGAS